MISSTTKTESVDEINSIVESATNRRIRNLISPSDLNESVKMMLINAIYFKDSFTSVSSHKRMGM